MRRLLLVVPVLLITAASSAAAQSAQPPVQATRVEVRSLVLRDAPARRGVSLVEPRREESFTLAALRAPRTGTLVGAAVGLVAGAVAAYAVLHSGGSNSLCDRSANQDAMNRGECAGLVALGGVVGAGVGALIGSRFGR